MFDKFYNKPLLMEPTRAQALFDKFLRHEDLEKDAAHFGEFQTSDFSPTFIEGVAVIPILGTLVNRRSSVGFFGGDISHQDIAATLIEAVADNSVRSILLDIDSGGGEANGAFDLSETIRELDAEKPIFAIANDAAFSGAFAIASAARKIFVTRTGGVGSIGVIAHHVDISEMHKNIGVKITPIFAGDFKGELSPFQPLSEGAKARVQADVDKTFEMFVNLIAEHRGLSAEKIISTKAGLFFGQDAVTLGLADQVATFDGAMEQILNIQEDSGMKLFSKVNKDVSGNKANTEENEEDVLDTEAESSTAAANTEENETDKTVSEEVSKNTEGDEVSEETANQNEVVYATAVEISQMALDAGCSSMIPSLLAEQMTVEEVEAKLNISEKIMNLCEKAGCPKKAEAYIKTGTPVVEVSEELIDLMAAESEKHDVSSKPDAKTIDNEAVKGYASNNEGTNPLVADAEKRNADFQTQYKGAE